MASFVRHEYVLLGLIRGRPRQRVELWDNGISRAGADALEAALRTNRALLHLGLLEHNDIASAYGTVAYQIDAHVARNVRAHWEGGWL